MSSNVLFFTLLNVNLKSAVAQCPVFNWHTKLVSESKFSSELCNSTSTLKLAHNIEIER